MMQSMDRPRPPGTRRTSGVQQVPAVEPTVSLRGWQMQTGRAFCQQGTHMPRVVMAALTSVMNPTSWWKSMATTTPPGPPKAFDIATTLAFRSLSSVGERDTAACSSFARVV